MKKTCIVFLSMLLVFSSILVSGTGKLKIDTENPRWFQYKGERIYLVSSGMGSVPQGKLLDDLTAAGVNAFRDHVFLNTDRKNNPYRLGKGASVDNNWNGWNETFFLRIKNQAKELEKRNCMYFLVIGGTPMRKEKHGTWGTHLWNAANGGPIPSAEHGVRSFYNLGKKEFVYKLPYKSKWSWQLKSQYRFEQLLVKIIQELPESRYPVGLIVMWEIYSGWNGEWTLHTVKLLQSLTESMPIGLGTYRRADLDYINSRSRRPVFGTFEGSTLINTLQQESLSGKYPILCQGFHCQYEGRVSGQHPENRCKFFIPGAEKPNTAGAIANMIASLQAGINTSLPFPSYWNGIDTYVKKACQGKYPIEKYNSIMVKNGILAFVKKFSTRVKRIDLRKIPGKKANKKINKWRKKHGY